MSIIIQDNAYYIPLYIFDTFVLVFVLKEFLFQLFLAENLWEKIPFSS